LNEFISEFLLRVSKPQLLILKGKKYAFKYGITAKFFGAKIRWRSGFV
jgi:hypothetical protein